MEQTRESCDQAPNPYSATVHRPGHAHHSLAGRAGRPLVLLLVALAVAQILADLLPTLLRDDLFAADAARGTWWMYRLANPTLFAGDPAAGYFAMAVYSPPGYVILFRWLTALVDTQHAAESTGIVLALLTLLLVVAIGHICGRKTGVAGAVCLFLLLHASRFTAGGFPRGFGPVMLLAGMLALMRHRWILLGLTMLGSALLYPPAVLPLGAATFIVMFIGYRRHGRLPRGFVPLALLCAFALIGLVSICTRPAPPGVGRWFTRGEVLTMPEWQAGGHSAYFQPWHDFYFAAAASGIGLSPTIAGLALLALLLTVALCPTTLPAEAWALLGGSLAVWLVAHLLTLPAYPPGLATLHALPVFGFIWAARLARESKLWLLARRPNRIVQFRRLAIGGAALATVVLLTADVRHALADYRQPGNNNWATADGYESVLAMLRTTTVDTRIAAHPTDANAIPLRCQRRVLANTATAVANHTGYYADARRRLNASFDLLYATDWPTVDHLADRDGVALFALDRTRLTAPDERPYDEPFATSNRVRIDAGRGRFAMLNPPPDRVLLSAGPWTVLRVGGGNR